jgi:hypothetical protein
LPGSQASWPPLEYFDLKLRYPEQVAERAEHGDLAALAAKVQPDLGTAAPQFLRRLDLLYLEEAAAARDADLVDFPVWQALLVVMTGADGHLVRQHEIAEHADAELAVGDHPQRRIEGRPGGLLSTELLPVDKALSGVAEDMLQRAEVHANAIVRALDEGAAVIGALSERDAARPLDRIAVLNPPVLLPGRPPAARVERVLVELADGQSGVVAVELAAHEQLADLLFGDLEAGERNLVGKLLVLSR